MLHKIHMRKNAPGESERDGPGNLQPRIFCGLTRGRGAAGVCLAVFGGTKSKPPA